MRGGEGGAGEYLSHELEYRFTSPNVMRFIVPEA